MNNSTLNGKKLALLILLIITASKVWAQVRIGPSTGSINGSVSLDVSSGPYASGSPYRGLLAPTVTTTQRSQIQSPVKGLLIFNTTTNQIEVNTGTTATPIWTPGGASGAGGSGWNLTGNAGTTSDNFIGTTDNVPLRFRVNNQNAGRIDPSLSNLAYGLFALNPATTGQGNTAIGTFALLNNTTSNYNTVLGHQALQNNTTGDGNTASGAVALQNNTAGHDNVALGAVSMSANTTGNYNVAAGAGALQKNLSGNENTIVGHNAAAANTTGFANVAVGADALIRNVDGHDNVVIGASALSDNTSGNGNTASGNLALQINTTGSSNTAAGLLALRYNTTGSYNTALGYDAGSLATAPGLINSTAIGANAKVGANNTIVLGDNNITALRCNVQTISSLSDKRIKEDIEADVPGLSFITRLTPVTYHVNKTKEAKLIGYPVTNINEDKVLHSGFLAQDVEEAAKAVGYNFEGVRQEEGGKYYTLGYTLFVIPLVQAVKDLSTEVNQLKAELAASKEAEKVNQARLDKLEALFQNTVRTTAVISHP